MGELSDDIITGRCCSLCMQYFYEGERPKNGSEVEIFEHGHPVVCEDCWKGLTPEEREMYLKAQAKTL